MTEEQKEQEQEQTQNGGSATEKKEQAEVKYTQEDLNAFAAKIRAEEKAKADKLKADLEKQAERAKMEENERLKAEKEDVEKQLQEMQAKIEYNEKRTNALKGLNDAKLDNRLIDVLLSDKSDEEKIKLMADVQKEVVDKAIKDAMPSHNPTSKTDAKSGFEDDGKVKYNFQKFK